ncbi:hypothetical protein ACFLSU_07600, partial [Bacteroidota bacterium]
MICKIFFLLLFNSLFNINNTPIAIVKPTMAIGFTQKDTLLTKQLEKASLFKANHQTEKALSLYFQILKRKALSNGIATKCNYEISEILEKTNNLDKSLIYAKKAIKHAIQTTDTLLILKNYSQVSRAHFNLFIKDSTQYKKHLDSIEIHALIALTFIKGHNFLKEKQQIYSSLSVYNYYK